MTKTYNEISHFSQLLKLEVWYVKNRRLKARCIKWLLYTPQACNFIKKEALAQVLSCEFCQISKNTSFTEHLWTTASILREERRLKPIEISIISKLTKKIIKKRKMFLNFLFFTCCAHPFSFRVSLFTKRPYVSLYSYFHYVQTWWIWKTYLNTFVKN